MELSASKPRPSGSRSDLRGAPVDDTIPILEAFLRDCGGGKLTKKTVRSDSNAMELAGDLELLKRMRSWNKFRSAPELEQDLGSNTDEESLKQSIALLKQRQILVKYNDIQKCIVAEKQKPREHPAIKREG